MPLVQIRLIRAHEDDLNLNKEERRLLRESEQAVRSRRRTIGIAAGVAALLLCGCGITWRYLFLRSHIFIQPQDRELLGYNWGIKQSYRMENIRLYAGSPARWWLDARLGFPELIYQTDFELDQLDPGHRDAVKAGAMFPQGTSIENEIFKLLPPNEAVGFLIAAGRPDEALKLAPGLFNNPSVDGIVVDKVLNLLGHSSVADPSILPRAVAHAFRIDSRRCIRAVPHSWPACC